ncbi:hypothetical protein B7P43_G07895 [Cryptotermes secundus]|uniref:Protein takeout n=1 Tax=Cryptotermes secundus TaxID=105785 RepID=A0A2J7QTI5_9NEOP|nr:hypothetical protein B7P43_G07895 [Cryptotermes secundus]
MTGKLSHIPEPQARDRNGEDPRPPRHLLLASQRNCPQVTCHYRLFVAADYIKKCSIKDPNFDACALKNAKESLPNLITGDTEHKIPVLDPLFVEELRVDAKTINSSLRRATVTGLKIVSLKSVRFDFDKKSIAVEAVLPVLNFTGDYEVKGKLIGIPIYGNGPMNASLCTYSLHKPENNTKGNYRTTYDLAKLDDGEVYLVLQDHRLTVDPAHATVELGNLFGGNEVLGYYVNKLINANWRAVLKQLGESINEAFGLTIHRIFSEAAKTVPYKDFFDDIE